MSASYHQHTKRKRLISAVFGDLLVAIAMATAAHVFLLELLSAYIEGNGAMMKSPQHVQTPTVKEGAEKNLSFV